MNYYFSSSY